MTNSIKVKDALFCAREVWSVLPEWLRNEYEKGNVLFLDKQVEIKQVRAELDDWLVFLNSEIFVVFDNYKLSNLIKNAERWNYISGMFDYAIVETVNNFEQIRLSENLYLDDKIIDKVMNK